MTTLLIHLLWAAIAALCIWRLDGFAHAWLDRSRPAQSPGEEVVVPHDIQSQAARWADEHARAAHLAKAVELYHDLGQDWDRARLALREVTE